MPSRSVSITSGGVTTTKIIPDRDAQAGVRTLTRSLPPLPPTPQNISRFTSNLSSSGTRDFVVNQQSHNGKKSWQEVINPRARYEWENALSTVDGSLPTLAGWVLWDYDENEVYYYSMDDTDYPFQATNWVAGAEGDSVRASNANFYGFDGGSPVPTPQSEDVIINRTAPVITSDRKGQSRPLLSKVVGGAAAAYSLRDLNDKAGNNKVVHVRRDGDNDEKTFLAKEINKIVDFTNGQNGFVETLYDQSGNDIHASQPATGLQPKIVDATTGLLTNGIDFNGNKYLNFASLPFADLSAFSVIHYASLPTSFVSTIVGNNTGFMTVLGTSMNNLAFVSNFPAQLTPQQSALPLNQNFYVGFNRVNNVVTGYVNGLATSSATDIGVTTLSSIGSAGVMPFQDSLSELIIYTADQSANRPAIEANINNQYSLY